MPPFKLDTTVKFNPFVVPALRRINFLTDDDRESKSRDNLTKVNSKSRSKPETFEENCFNGLLTIGEWKKGENLITLG